MLEFLTHEKKGRMSLYGESHFQLQARAIS
jgi:hypothetical protein